MASILDLLLPSQEDGFAVPADQPEPVQNPQEEVEPLPSTQFLVNALLQENSRPGPPALLSQCTPLVPEPLEPNEILQRVAVEVATERARALYGWSTLRSFQQRAVEAVASGRNVFILSGTGSGKSGCFTLPALVERTWMERFRVQPLPVALVISPLIALMQDQVQRLKAAGIPAGLCSSQSGPGWERIWQQAVRGELALCYMSPELAFRWLQDGTLQSLQHISLVAVDEAHCVSEWGHDFRPEYGQLRDVIKALDRKGRGGQPPPVVALTATCAPAARGDVLRSLGIEGAEQVLGSMNRPNLFYEVLAGGQQMMAAKLLEVFEAARPEDPAAVAARREVAVDPQSLTYGPAIVYCRRIADCEDVAKLLQKSGIRAGAFYSKMPAGGRNAVQTQWCRDELQVVVATIAFGMGIDKPTVRRVVHYGLPRGLESYAQESGRAGRDGQRSVCTVLFCSSERHKHERALLSQGQGTIEQVSMQLMRIHAVFGYCENRTQCRRATLLAGLGEPPLTGVEGACSRHHGSQLQPLPGVPGYVTVESTSDGAELRCYLCDVCTHPSRTSPVDACMELRELLAASHSMMGRLKLSEGARKQCRGGRGRDLPVQAWYRLIDAAVDSKYLTLSAIAGQRGHRVAVYSLTQEGRLYLDSVQAPPPFRVDLGVPLDPVQAVEQLVADPVERSEDEVEDPPEPAPEEPPAPPPLPQLLHRLADEVQGVTDRELAALLLQKVLETKQHWALLQQPLQLAAAVQVQQPLPVEADGPQAAGEAASEVEDAPIVAVPAAQWPQPRQLLGAARQRSAAPKGRAAPPQEQARSKRRCRRYTDAERRGVPRWIEVAMELADFNSNQPSGAEGFKKKLAELLAAAPPPKRQRIQEVGRQFKSNTPGRHGFALDAIIEEWQGESARRGGA